MKKKIIVIFILMLVANCRIPAQKNNIKVETINKAKLEEIIKNRNGKILLLNLWATWCIPCRQEFPDIVKLSKEYKKKTLEIIAISLDYPEDIKTKIIPFLNSHNSDFKVYVNNFKNDEELINFIDPKFTGAIPATVIYDSTGKKSLFIEGKKSYLEFKEAVDRVLEK